MGKVLAPKKVKKSIVENADSNFKKWFKGSKVVDKEGNPIIVYHATTHEFFEFTKERGNVENHFGIGYYFTDSKTDAESNYLSDGADLTQRIETTTDRMEGVLEDKYGDIFESKKQIAKDYGLTPNQVTVAGDFRNLARIIARKKLKGEHQIVLPFYLKFLNPINVTQDKDATRFDALEGENEDGDYEENTDSLPYKLMEAIQTVMYDFYDSSFRFSASDLFSAIGQRIDYDWDWKSAYEVDKAFRNAINEEMGIEEFQDEEGNLASHEFIRRVYEEMGFDGIVMDADLEFGNKRKIGKAMAMDYGTRHYIAFQPNQIKLANGSNTTFDENNPDIRFDKGGEINKFEYTIGGL